MSESQPSEIDRLRSISLRGDDIHIDLNLELREVVLGGEKELRIPRLEQCDTCQGNGYWQNVTATLKVLCSGCNGCMRVEQIQRLKIPIPAGVDDGTRLRISRAGSAGIKGGTYGDLYISLSVNENSQFQKSGRNIISILEIEPAQALLGCKLDIMTIHGSSLLVIPPETKHGTILKLANRGVPLLGSSSICGHHLVTIVVK